MEGLACYHVVLDYGKEMVSGSSTCYSGACPYFMAIIMAIPSLPFMSKATLKLSIALPNSSNDQQRFLHNQNKVCKLPHYFLIARITFSRSSDHNLIQTCSDNSFSILLPFEIIVHYFLTIHKIIFILSILSLPFPFQLQTFSRLLD